MQERITYETLYPQMYYRIQPFILSACDHIDQCGYGMPMKEVVSQVSNQVYQDVCGMYPEFAAYAGVGKRDVGNNVEASRYVGGGLLRDVLDIWLLNELFNRRRRW